MPLNIPVFISSKQSELVIERDLMAEKVRGVPPLEPVIAEEWAPQAKRVQEVMLDKVRVSPIYVGLFASVYSEPTELEYREAIKNPYREVLIYVKNGAQRDAKLAELVERMQDDHVITKYNDARDLLQRFGDHLREAVSRMILLLQKLGEAEPVARSFGEQGGESRLRKKWLEEQGLLSEFALAGLAVKDRNEVLYQLRQSLGGAL